MNVWFDEIYRTHYAALHAYATRLARGNLLIIQEIPDILQNVFMALFARADSLQSHPNIVGWLKLTTLHKLSDARESILLKNSRRAYSRDDSNAIALCAQWEARATLELESARRATEIALARIEDCIGAENMALLKAYYSDDAEALPPLSNVALRKRVSRIRSQLKATRI